MKRTILLPIFLVTAMLTACAPTESLAESGSTLHESTPAVTENTTESLSRPTESVTALATTAVSENASEPVKRLSAEELSGLEQTLCDGYSDSTGRLTELFAERVEEIRSAVDDGMSGTVFPDLWDFDRDGVPEVLIANHYGGQGCVPVRVYRADDLSLMGEFEGYCRDGYTRYSYDENGNTLVHNYYEHSYFIRYERWESFALEDGMLVRASFLENDEKWADTQGDRWSQRPDVEKMKTDEYVSDYFRSAQEYSLFDYSTMINLPHEEYARPVVDRYNQLVSLRERAEEIPDVICFAVGDYDGDMRFEAFVQKNSGEDNCIYFINSNGETTRLEERYRAWQAYKLYDGYIVFQMFTNGYHCLVYTVRDGQPVLLEKPSMGMNFDYDPDKIGDFVVYDSEYDGINLMGGHSWKPYYFTFDGQGEIVEYGAEYITAEEFVAKYGAQAQAAIDSAQEKFGFVAEVIRSENGQINLNCRTYMEDTDETVWQNDYITYKDDNGTLVEINSGNGFYKLSIADGVEYTEE